MDILTLTTIAAQFTPFGNLILSSIGLYKVVQGNEILQTIILIIFALVFCGGIAAIGWFLQRSSTFSALKKHEIWKNKKSEEKKL